MPRSGKWKTGEGFPNKQTALTNDDRRRTAGCNPDRLQNGLSWARTHAASAQRREIFAAKQSQTRRPAAARSPRGNRAQTRIRKSTSSRAVTFRRSYYRAPHQHQRNVCAPSSSSFSGVRSAAEADISVGTPSRSPAFDRRSIDRHFGKWNQPAPSRQTSGDDGSTSASARLPPATCAGVNLLEPRPVPRASASRIGIVHRYAPDHAGVITTLVTTDNPCATEGTSRRPLRGLHGN